MGKKKKPKTRELSELDLVRSLWQEAMCGDEVASARLLLYLSRYRTVDLFVKQFAYMALNYEPSSKMKITKPKSPTTLWEKGRANLQSGRVSLVQGGLPSLGKRSR